MNIEWLERLNPFWTEKDFRFEVKDREKYLKQLTSNDKLTKVLVGARRVGKTFLLYSLINKLLNKRKRVLYLSGEMREVSEYGLRAVIEEILSHNKWEVTSEVFVFIDEVQEIKDWQKVIKFYYDYSKFKFYLTGSSSLVLNSQTEKLTGRFLTIPVMPLDYSEWLEFIERTPNTNQWSVEEYLVSGGYPEYVLRENDEYLREVVKSTLYRDLLSYYGIRNPKLLEELMKYLADKVTTQVSTLRIKADLKVDDKTAAFYLKYLEEVYLIFPLYRLGGSYRRVKAGNPKYYFNDTGVLRMMSINQKIGYLAENAVFLKLLGDKNREVFYDNEMGRETDFVDRKGRRVEVKYRTDIEVDLDEINGFGVETLVIVPDVEKIKNADRWENLELISLGVFLLG
jgi:predicted AAA+ superfamily ATPase